jgi:hypothetical protein
MTAAQGAAHASGMQSARTVLKRTVLTDVRR